MNNKNTDDITDRECEEMVFRDCCLEIIENPKSRVDDIEAIHTVANFENPDREEKVLRLATALKMLEISPKNAFNKLFMAALLDYKQFLGIKGEIVLFNPSQNKGG